jgi:DNA/RNA-binding domain of Phe-tRNA-synthetase-like protein
MGVFMPLFHYDQALLEKFPTICGGVILAQGMTGGPTPPELLDAYRTEQETVRQRIGDGSLAEIPSLGAWRRAFTAFGVKPTQYRSAAEALLRRLTKQGDIPSVNRLVDIGNMVSIRYALPIAVLDLAAVTGQITVRLADGSERFTTLDTEEVDNPAAGEVIFIDAAGTVHARRWCWRQSETSAARDTTTNALITVEAHHATGREDVQHALADLMDLFARYAGGEMQSAVLGPDQPSFG